PRAARAAGPRRSRRRPSRRRRWAARCGSASPAPAPRTRPAPPRPGATGTDRTRPGAAPPRRGRGGPGAPRRSRAADPARGSPREALQSPAMSAISPLAAAFLGALRRKSEGGAAPAADLEPALRALWEAGRAAWPGVDLPAAELAREIG